MPSGAVARVRLGAAALAAATAVWSAVPVPAVAHRVERSAANDAARPADGGAPWTAAARARLGADIDAALGGAATLRGAHVGLLAIDTERGDVLYARAADDAFVPASTLKLVVGSVALALLGPEFRYRTEALLGDGGRLWLRPSGDPLLSAGDLTTLATALAAAGVSALPGGIAVDTGAFASAPYAPGWAWDDLVYDYAPVSSAAVIEENVVHLTVAPGATAGAPARVSAAPLPLDAFLASGTPGGPAIVSHALTGPAATPASVDLARDAGGEIDVTGSVPLGGPPAMLDAAVPDPVWYLRALASAAVRRAGVAVGLAPPSAAGVPAGARTVWRHEGEPLRDLLADLWWPSDNLIAEQLLRTLGPRPAGAPATIEAGLAAERAWLAGIGVDVATLTLADGSGLSVYDRATPRALVTVLQADWRGPYRDLILDDLPVAGVRGTLEGAFLGSLAERRTFAKTGSVMHARGLAGYLATLRHGPVTFAWSVDDWQGDAAGLDALRARVLSRIIGD